MESRRGLYSGKTRSTPSPDDSLRTVKEELRPRLRRAMQTPSKAWTRSRVPSTTFTFTRTVSPGAKAGGSPSAVSLPTRSEEHTSELQSLMRISYAVFCLKKKKKKTKPTEPTHTTT